MIAGPRLARVTVFEILMVPRVMQARRSRGLEVVRGV